MNKKKITELIILVSSESSSSSAEKQQVKRKNSLQRLEGAKRFKKMEKRGLPTVDSDDDLGDMTDSFSSGCSTYDSDDWSDFEDKNPSSSSEIED
jgi:hypothetical protein